MGVAASRTEKLDLRLSAAATRALQAAAIAAHRSVSEFVLESALARAEETQPERQHFGLDAEQWQAFMTALDAPTRKTPKLDKLLSTASIFESNRQK